MGFTCFVHSLKKKITDEFDLCNICTENFPFIEFPRLVTKTVQL